MNISRRDIVGGLAATPIATMASATTEDAELVALGEQFTYIANLESTWKDKATLLSRLGEIGTAIMNTPATTMEGFVVKARIACFVQGGNVGLWNDNEQDQAGWPNRRGRSWPIWSGGTIPIWNGPTISFHRPKKRALPAPFGNRRKLSR